MPEHEIPRMTQQDAERHHAKTVVAVLKVLEDALGKELAEKIGQRHHRSQAETGEHTPSGHHRIYFGTDLEMHPDVLAKISQQKWERIMDGIGKIRQLFGPVELSHRLEQPRKFATGPELLEKGDHTNGLLSINPCIGYETRNLIARYGTDHARKWEIERAADGISRPYNFLECWPGNSVHKLSGTAGIGILSTYHEPKPAR